MTEPLLTKEQIARIREASALGVANGDLWPLLDQAELAVDLSLELKAADEIDKVRMQRIADLESQLAAEREYKKNPGKISDGYHTFDELYDHRITLWIALCRKTAATVREMWNPTWRSKLHSDGTAFDGWFMLGMFHEAGHQITYHLPLSRWDETDFAVTRERAPEFDGHTSDDVLKRITKL